MRNNGMDRNSMGRILAESYFAVTGWCTTLSHSRCDCW